MAAISVPDEERYLPNSDLTHYEVARYPIQRVSILGPLYYSSMLGTVYYS
jgi:hypothetical protein